jgi:pSer/pThr/pTyr-binding forkhead associated (FHA) protein
VTNAFYVEIVPPDGKLRRFILPVEQLLVGRSQNRCQLLIPDPRVSRIHLRIIRSPDLGVTITDMHSANGSSLDGHLLPPGMAITWLIDQMVSIGSTQLTLRYGQAPNAPA